MAEPKKPEEMSLGEIVRSMITISIRFQEDTHEIGSKDAIHSPYHTDEELRNGILKNYRSVIDPLEQELQRRESEEYRKKYSL
ncbi:MAG: hypothetical protein V1743_04565 [Nanoarchaeota archaeon]